MVPRMIIAGRTYLLTRRCSERRFFLRPGKNVNAIVRYALFKAARLWRVEVHGWTVMSNHLHIVATDKFRELSNFMRTLDLEISKGVSPEIGRWGGLWEPGQFSAVELLDTEAMIEKLAYVLANPVSARLVRRATRWPGETSVHMAFGEVAVARRPATRYYRNSRQPESYELRLEPLPGMDPATCLEIVRRRVRAIEKATDVKMRNEQRKFLGPLRVLRQDPYDSPTSWEKRRGLNPTYASRDKWKRIETAQRNRAWLSAYREALARYRAGERDVIFPYGTWAMDRIYGCNCAPAPT
jgi:putative transposase